MSGRKASLVALLACAQACALSPPTDGNRGPEAALPAPDADRPQVFLLMG